MLRNLWSSGELRQRGTSERFRSVEIPATERPPIIDACKRAAGRTGSSYFAKLPDPAAHPVFRIEPNA